MADADDIRNGKPQGTAVMPQKTDVMSQKTAVMPSGTDVRPQGTEAVEVSYAVGETIIAGGKSYTVTGIIGRGSEGDIYVVSGATGRYALKLCHKGIHTNVKVMPALQKLNGKGYITDIVDYGDDFELLEYVPAGSAASVSLKGNNQAILALAVKTAMALDMMHREGVIHKDVKPANILIKDKAGWNSVLCDFGIADVLGPGGKCTTRQSRTPIYASPEMYAKDNTVQLQNETFCELTAKSDF